MQRRDTFSAIAAALAVGAGTQVQAQTHDHSKMQGPGPTGAGPYQGVAVAAADCIGKAQACLAHCLVLLGEGDKSMAECAQTVNQVLALCGALQNLANQQSNLTRALARVALDACQADDFCIRRTRDFGLAGKPALCNHRQGNHPQRQQH